MELFRSFVWYTIKYLFIGTLVKQYALSTVSLGPNKKVLITWIKRLIVVTSTTPVTTPYQLAIAAVNFDSFTTFNCYVTSIRASVTLSLLLRIALGEWTRDSAGRCD
jgi:hypothetical protein